MGLQGHEIKVLSETRWPPV